MIANVLRYGDYYAEFGYDDSADAFHGRVIGIDVVPQHQDRSLTRWEAVELPDQRGSVGMPIGEVRTVIAVGRLDGGAEDDAAELAPEGEVLVDQHPPDVRVPVVQLRQLRPALLDLDHHVLHQVLGEVRGPAQDSGEAQEQRQLIAEPLLELHDSSLGNRRFHAALTQITRQIPELLCTSPSWVSR